MIGDASRPAAAVRALLQSGLTVRDVAELLRAHPAAIESLAAHSVDVDEFALLSREGLISGKERSS